MSIKVLAGHSSQTVEIWHDDGMIKLDFELAKDVHSALELVMKQLMSRGKPPCPPDFIWDDQKAFADSSPCTAVSPENHSDCGGGLAAHEFSLEEFFNLRNWLNELLEYHRKCGCPNLKKLEKKSK